MPSAPRARRNLARISCSRASTRRVPPAATRVAPTYEVGTESQLAWVDRIAEMPGKTTLENTGAQKLAAIHSYQHPDHDTGPDWKPRSEPD